MLTCGAYMLGIHMFMVVACTYYEEAGFEHANGLFSSVEVTGTVMLAEKAFYYGTLLSEVTLKTVGLLLI